MGFVYVKKAPDPSMCTVVRLPSAVVDFISKVFFFVFAEAEHGYASTLPMPDDLRSVSKRPKTKKSQGNR